MQHVYKDNNLVLRYCIFLHTQLSLFIGLDKKNY